MPRRVPFPFRLLSLSFCLLAVVGLLAAPPRSAAQARPPTLTIGVTERLTALDPADAGDVFAWETLTHLYSGLTRQVPGTLRYELALAADYRVSDDGLTHTFTIRPDAAFDDGTPISAVRFAESINRTLRLNGAGAKVVAPYLKAASAQNDTLTLTTHQPIPFMWQLAALPPLFAVHPDDFPPDRLNSTPRPLHSSGVYKLVAADSDSLSLTANPTWKGDAPASAAVAVRRYAYPAELRRALTAGEIDVAWRGLPPEETAQLAGVQNVRLAQVASLQTYYLVISQAARPFSAPAARQNLLGLLDRERLAAETMRGSVRPLYTLLPPELANSSTPRYPGLAPLETVKDALRQAQYSRYNTIDSELQTARFLYGDLLLNGAERLAADVQRSEVYRWQVQDTEPQALFDQIERGTFRLLLIGWTPAVPHADAYLRPLLHSAGLIGAGAKFNSAAVDDLLARAARETDLNVQGALYNEAQREALKAVVVVPLWQAQQTVATRANVEGVLVEPNPLLRWDRLRVR
jgi:peptide/nickel transport system substrate-binding protein